MFVKTVGGHVDFTKKKDIPEGMGNGVGQEARVVGARGAGDG